MKLRKVLKQFITGHALEDRKQEQCVVAQFSSMGSLNEKYIQELSVSMFSQKQTTFGAKQRIKFVWPSIEDVRLSNQGYNGESSEF